MGKDNWKTFNIFGQIKEEMEAEIINGILQHCIAVKKDPVIVFMIDSIGGDIEVFYRIRNILKVTNPTVYTVCVGKAYSAAGRLFLLGDKRVMLGKESKLMYHEVRTRADLVYTELLKSVEETTSMMDDVKKSLSKITKISKQRIAKKLQDNWFLTAEDALENGIATEILNNMKEVNSFFEG